MPPSSRQTFAIRSPATLAIIRPTALEPVKLTTSTPGCSTSAWPASAPKPVDEVEDAGRERRPRSARRLNACAVSGVFSDGLRTTPLPHSSAGKTFQATFAIGVFAAMISPATPSGWRIVIAWRLGTALVVVRP